MSSVESSPSLSLSLMEEVKDDENEGHDFTLGSRPSTVHLSLWHREMLLLKLMMSLHHQQIMLLVLVTLVDLQVL